MQYTNNNQVTFQYNGKEYKMTSEEIEAAYRYQEREYRLMDALRHLNKFAFGFCDCDYEPDASDIEEFDTRYGIPYAEAVKMTEAFLEEFEDEFDCNIDENTQWSEAIRRTLERAKKNRQLAGIEGRA